MHATHLVSPQIVAALARHRHGPRIVVLGILFVAVVVAVFIWLQHRRDRNVVSEASISTTAFASTAAVTSHPTTATEGAQHMTMSAAVPPGTGPAVRADQPPVVVVARTTRPNGRYGIGGLLCSEFTKLRTVRSTMWTLGITIVIGLGISALATAETRAHWSTMSPGDRFSFDPTSTSLIGLFIGQFSIGILGALVMSAEFGTGTIRATFSASPRRPLVLTAKAIVFGAVSLIVAEVVAFLSFFLGQALLTAPAFHATLATPQALRQVVGSGLYICVLGLFALGLATIIRHTAGAISAFVGILLVLPLVTAALPGALADDVRKFLPDRIGAEMISNTLDPNTFSPWTGMLLLVGYAAAALVIGGILLNKRDA